MQYDIPSAVSVGTQDRLENLDGFITLRKILSHIKLADISLKVTKFNCVSILDMNPKYLHHVMNTINRWRFEANKAAEKEKISEEDVVKRIKDNIQGSKHLNFVSDFNKSY